VNNISGDIAQSVEQRTENPCVAGSIPAVTTTVNKQEYFVYILWSDKISRYYIGSTSNINSRLADHNSGKAVYTRKGKPWILVYSEVFSSKVEAQKAERKIKAMKSSKFIENLIINNSVGRAPR
jgi:putative endonuclease